MTHSAATSSTAASAAPATSALAENALTANRQPNRNMTMCLILVPPVGAYLPNGDRSKRGSVTIETCRSLSGLACLTVLAAALAGRAVAQDNYEIQVYGFGDHGAEADDG